MALVPSVKKMLALFLLLSTTATTLLCSADHDVAPICDASNDELRLNQIQVVGTHNSYHMRTHREVRDVVDKVIPGIMQLMDYELPPLREQLEDYRVRAFEFDVFYDPSILYARPSGLAVVEGEINAFLFFRSFFCCLVVLLFLYLHAFVEQCDCTLQPPYDQEGVMATSTNSKVFHVQDVDYRTHCYTLVDCLSQLMEWSNSVDGHHTPLFIQLELKANPLPILPSMAEELGFHPVVPLSWANPTALASLEEEILGVIPLDRILSPASLTNDHPNMTLSQVVTEVGWPTISESMGKFIFFLDNNPVSDVQQVFSNTSLPRFIFRERPEGEPDAAIFKRNNPKTHYENIQDLVGKGYIVRARADSDTTEARNNDYSTQEAAWSSGAQIISTDYVRPDRTLIPRSEYVVHTPNHCIAQCNPIAAADILLDEDFQCEPIDYSTSSASSLSSLVLSLIYA
ncbi:Phosphoinositide phospholipase C, Ca2+-dependent [Balamuthia mandrillaris]